MRKDLLAEFDRREGIAENSESLQETGVYLCSSVANVFSLVNGYNF